MRTTINVERPTGMQLPRFFWLVKDTFGRDPDIVQQQEQTWVMEWSGPAVLPSAAKHLAHALGEDCIAQVLQPDGQPAVGSLPGPRPAAWEPFDVREFKWPK